ncbi:MAG: cytochrome c-550 [Cyanothece sp. SIO1E1]|nr:cytochrome c-550 [Cyanothece sp. SIO1E1]
MFRKYAGIALATLFCFCTFFVGNAAAIELDEAVRTVPLNTAGDTVVLSDRELAIGKKQFNYACATCHVAGGTKTNPNVNLTSESLAGAFPNRNSIEGIVDYLNNPTTYDGLIEIAEFHPSTQSTDVFPKMRNLTDQDLVAIAGHILVQPKVRGEKWGGGKSYN